MGMCGHERSFNMEHITAWGRVRCVKSKADNAKENGNDCRSKVLK